MVHNEESTFSPDDVTNYLPLSDLLPVGDKLFYRDTGLLRG